MLSQRDRLAGLEATAQGGQVETAMHIASGRLHVNADASGGEVAAEVIGQDGRVVEGYEAASCEALRADAPDHGFRWRDGRSEIRGRRVAVRLHLKGAEVLSLWWG